MIFRAVIICCCVLGATAVSRAQINTADTAAYYSPAAAQGLNPRVIDSLANFINTLPPAWNSYLIVKNGFIVDEHYQYPFYASTPVNIHSCTKSVLSILMGIAMKQGFIKSVEQSFLSFVANGKPNNTLAGLDSLKIKHLLTMTAAVAVDEKSFKDRNDIEDIARKMKITALPGTVFDYNEIAPQLLVLVIEKATGMGLKAFADKYLFGPLGITNYVWLKIGPQLRGGSGLRLTPVDFAKLGWLMTDTGRWNGQEFIDRQYWAAAIQDEGMGYGYFWWPYPGGAFAAIGHDCQYLYCSPKQRMCFAFCSHMNDSLRTILIDTIANRFLNKVTDTVLTLAATPALIKRALCMGTLPQWLKALTNRPINGKSGSEKTVFNIQAPDECTVLIEIKTKRLDLHLKARINEAALGVSHVNQPADDEAENYIYLASTMEFSRDSLLIAGEDIVGGGPYNAALSVEKDMVNFRFSTGDIGLINFKGALSKK